MSRLEEVKNLADRIMKEQGPYRRPGLEILLKKMGFKDRTREMPLHGTGKLWTHKELGGVALSFYKGEVIHDHEITPLRSLLVQMRDDGRLKELFSGVQRSAEKGESFGRG